MMPETQEVVLAVVTDLIEQTAIDAEECVNSPLSTISIRANSPPTDLFEDEDEVVDVKRYPNLEFFCDILDVTPTQFYASQRDSLAPNRTMRPPSSQCAPKENVPKIVLNSPNRIESSQALFKTPPVTPIGCRGIPRTSTLTTPRTVADIATTPRRSQCLPNESYILASPFDTPRYTGVVLHQQAQEHLTQSSPGNAMSLRLNELLPKKNLFQHFVSSSDKPVAISPSIGGFEWEPSEIRKGQTERNEYNMRASTNEESPTARPEGGSKYAAVQEFCPPYSVGAYQTAPLWSRSSRSIRVGLSRRRRHPQAAVKKLVYQEE